MNLSKLCNTLLFIVLITVQVRAQETAITLNELPAKAQIFLKTHFPGQPTSSIIKDSEMFSTDYTVRLASGNKIEFDSNGNWNEVKGKNNPLPTSFIPTDIIKYVKEKFPDNTITKIEKNYWNYEVKISNGLELDFNSKGKFIRIDD